MFWLSLYLTLLAAIFYYFHRQFTFWSRNGVNSEKFLTSYGFWEEPHSYTLRMSDKYGPVYGGYALSYRFLVINKPELIKTVFIKNFNEFPDRFRVHISPSPRVNQMLTFLLGHDKWRRIRSAVSPAFTSHKLKGMVSHIWDIADSLMDKLVDLEKKGDLVDMKHYLGCYIMDVFSACAYGIKLDSLKDKDHPVPINVQKVVGFDANFSTVTSVLLPKLAAFLKLNLFDIEAINFFSNLFEEIRRKRMNTIDSSSGTVPNKTDFIQILLDSEINNETLASDGLQEGLTLDELISQGVLFLVAGYDPTTSALCHVVYHLANNKDCQQTLYEGLKDMSELTMDNLNDHKYLNAVIDESLRLSPPLLRVQRQCDKDFVLDGIKIPAGTSLDVCPYALHRDPDLWPDPLAFKPDRFLECKHDPCAYMPFGAGPRNCVGKRFGEFAMRILCAKLFAKFEFDLAHGFKPEYFKGNFALIPKTMMVKLKLR